MRFILDKTTNEVLGVIESMKTSYLPPMEIGTNSRYFDIDYTINDFEDETIKLIHAEKGNLAGKVATTDFEKTITFSDKEVTKEKAIVVDLKKPKFDKDVAIYAKKAEDSGATVEIEDIGSVIKATIKAGGKVVGDIFLDKWDCCSYIYTRGEVYNRDFYPHYLGFVKLIDYLQKEKKNINSLDMGGFSKEKGINDFKLKFGQEKYVNY